MHRVFGCLPVFQMTGNAFGSKSRINIINVATGARGGRMFPGERELGRIVIELRALPLRGVVTQLAGLRKTRGYVVDTFRRLIILDVAGRTSRRQSRKLIVHMARRAGHRRVLARQRKLGRIVIELCAQPLRGGVAGLAILREPCCLVRRILGRLPVFQMTSDAFGPQASKYVVHMATRAGHRGVFAGQRKLAQVVIELGTLPRRRGVAGFTLLREIGLAVIRVHRPVVVFQMTTAAGRGCALKNSARVALRAGYGNMFSGKRKARKRRVIELCPLPSDTGVAERAIARESRRHVIRIRSPREIRRVTTEAIRRRPLKFSAHMATGARQIHMRPGQYKFCQTIVIEPRVLPTIGHVAGAAIGGKPRRTMIQRRGLVIVLDMTTGAIGGKPGEGAAGSSFVAAFATHRRMCSEQGKAVPMRLRGARVHPPALHGVALLALRPKLPAMKIGMAIGALGSRSGKYFRNVAGATRNTYVHPPQRVMGTSSVIELRRRPQRRPTGGGMAVLASNRDWPMGIPNRRIPHRVLRPQRHRSGEGKHTDNKPLVVHCAVKSWGAANA